MHINIEEIRKYCLSLPHTTEDIQWGNDLLFRIGGKIYAGVNLGAAGASHLSFKCSPEDFASLIEQEGIVPAPYVARYHWVSLERLDALNGNELRMRLRDSYEMVLARLPKKIRDGLAAKKITGQRRRARLPQRRRRH
jgi:predicted DNA-binding protein (MmcQ/YjbR family)